MRASAVTDGHVGSGVRTDAKRASKELSECRVPLGFRLVTPQPTLVVMHGLVVKGFILAWAPEGADEYFHVHRYEQKVPDDLQMDWALQDFRAALKGADIHVGEARRKPPAALRLTRPERKQWLQ